MKYIRTKDRIFEVIAKEKLSYKVKTDDPIVLPIPFENVIKQADNIEELCDEFCLEQPLQDIEHIWFLNRAENYKEFIQRYNQSKWCEKLTSGWQKEAINGYGAIYTDKGLIYVAELNEKGNWELI